MSNAARRLYRYFPYWRDETHCKLVSSRGLLKSCRIKQNKPSSATTKLPSLPSSFPSDVPTVYICTNALELFEDQSLRHIDKPFVLVSGDSPRGVNPEEINSVDEICENEFLRSWYAQNLTKTSDKQCHMPLGMDFHTLSRQKNHPWGPFSSPVEQERILVDAARNAPRLHDKARTGYCNWHFALDRGTRRECMAKIDGTAVDFEPNPLPRKQSWINNAKMLFTISPTGAGLDCHRTWEAIALGSIPVIDRSAISPLFSSLPVIEIDDWSQVTSDFLNNQAIGMIDRKYDFAPMFLEYWKRKIVGKSTPTMAMTFQEFIDEGFETFSRIASRV